VFQKREFFGLGKIWVEIDPMSAAFRSEETQLLKLRERLREMTNDELVRFGELVRDFSDRAGARDSKRREPNGENGTRIHED
jgi:hypothetical protein